MAKKNSWALKGCAILAAVIVGVPLLIVSVVGFRTWVPLQEAGQALDELDRSLGSEAAYQPAITGEIATERMVLFLELRSVLVTACGDYGGVQQGFDMVESLDSKDSADLQEVGDVAAGLGGAALSITPFLARFFELRNEALLAVSMGLEEYAFIYAVAYHEHLLSPRTRNQIFSDGNALSPEASVLLKGCLARQREAMDQAGSEIPHRDLVDAEWRRMEHDPSRLIWQDDLPDAVLASVTPYRERLDRVFCGATAGLEMERDADRALRVALE